MKLNLIIRAANWLHIKSYRVEYLHSIYVDINERINAIFEAADFNDFVMDPITIEQLKQLHQSVHMTVRIQHGVTAHLMASDLTPDAFKRYNLDFWQADAAALCAFQALELRIKQGTVMKGRK